MAKLRKWQHIYPEFDQCQTLLHTNSEQGTYQSPELKRLSKKSQCHPYTFVYISMINDHSVSSFYLAESTSRYRNSDDYYINKTHVKRKCAHNVITHTIFTCLRKYLQNVNLESV